jgi:hypothetical protein
MSFSSSKGVKPHHHQHNNSNSHAAMATINLHALAAQNKGGTLLLQSNNGTLPMVLPWASLLSTNNKAPSVDITDDEVLIGRKAKDCTVVINNPAISGLHCRVYRKEANQPWPIQLGTANDIPKPPQTNNNPADNNLSNSNIYDADSPKQAGSLVANFANKLKSLFTEDSSSSNNNINKDQEESIEDTNVVWKGTKNATLKLKSAVDSKAQKYCVWLEDLSTNGTFIGNHKIGQPLHYNALSICLSI